MHLAPGVAAAGVRLITYERVDSTNAQALDFARAGERGPLWITAREQTAGRGREGRRWISEPGNLYATLLLSDPAPADRAAQLSFVTALAVHDAIVGAAPKLAGRVALKWPNDVLCDGAKTAGILIEAEGSRPLAVAVGIGVNCHHHPDATTYPATDLGAVGAAVTVEALFEHLSAAMVARLREWDGGRGFAAIRSAWMQRAWGIGRAIRVQTSTRAWTGAFEAIDAAGRLMVRLSDGTVQAVAAGDVFPIDPAAT